MTLRPELIASFLGASPAALVRVDAARGSTPREAGAWMLVSRDGMLGTIGGGQLEYIAIDAARALLARGEARRALEVPLGPEIGQCCGGRIGLEVVRIEGRAARALLEEARSDRQALPVVHVMGAGHVGRALAAALALLPVRTLLVDGRREELALAPAAVETILTPIPEAVVRDAAPGGAFAVMTHDHALDFLIVREALARRDTSYVGMIGSRTKRASFLRWAREAGSVESGSLVCPIGAAGRPDKRPEVIAAFVAAEIMKEIAAWRDRSRTAVPAGTTS